MKTILTLLKILMMLLLGTILNAQPVLQWQKNLGGSGNDSLWSIKTTREGGYIIAGQSSSNNGDVSGNHGGMDYWVVKMNATGNIAWQKCFGGSGDDVAKCIQQTSDGGYIMTGYSMSFDGDVTGHGRSGWYNSDTGVLYDVVDDETWVLKLDDVGNITMNQNIGEIWTTGGMAPSFISFPTHSNFIIQTSDGGYLLEFLDEFYHWGENDYGENGPAFLRKFGTIEFQKSLMLGVEKIPAIVETNSGFVSVAYSHFSGGIIINAVNNAGVTLWNSSIYDFDTEDYGKRFFTPYSMQKTNDGGFIVAGSTISQDLTFGLENTVNHGADDFWLMKLDSLGNKIWSRCYGGSGNDVAKSVQQMPDGSYMIAGTSYSTDGQVTGHTVNGTVHQADYWIVNVDSAGNFISGKCYGGSANDDVYSMEKTLDGGIIVAGTSSSTDAGFVNKGNADYWILKLNFCGTVHLPVACHQSFCSSCNPLVSNLKANGTNLKWYQTAKGGNALLSTVKLVTGNYYVSQTNANGCESERKAVDVKVNLTPVAPYAPAIQVFHKKKSAIVANLIAYGTSLKWYSVSTGGYPLPPSAKLVTGCYYVSQTSSEGCESGRKKVSVIVRSHHSSSHRPGDEGDDEEDLMISASVYPNPAVNMITINIKTANTTDDANVEVMNAEGKVLLQQIVLNTKGLVQKAIDISKLPDGFYILKYVIGKETGSLKLQVNK